MSLLVCRFRRMLAFLDGYAVSDGNPVLDTELSINPMWQPLPMGVQWYKAYACRSAAGTFNMVNSRCLLTRALVMNVHHG
jgi:hypothetical protein